MEAHWGWNPCSKHPQTTFCVSCCFCLTVSLSAGCRERLQQTTKRGLTLGSCPDNHTVLVRNLIGPLHIWLQGMFWHRRWAKGWSCRYKVCKTNLGPPQSSELNGHKKTFAYWWGCLESFFKPQAKKNWTKRKHHHFLGEKETAGQMCVYFTYSANNMAMRSCLSVTEDLYWRQIRKMHSLHKRACKYTASLSLNKYIHRGSQKSNTPPQQISY